MTDSDVMLELDERRRASLGRIGRPEHNRYLVTEEPDGTIVLRPAVVLTEMEVRMLANRELLDRIDAVEQDPSLLVRRSRRRPAGQ